MADWYVSSAALAALPAWQPTHAYTVGQIIRPVTATGNSAWSYRCTVAGTSGSTEPTWATFATGNNSTTTDGGVTWQNVSGQSTYNWTAPAGSLYNISGNTFPRTSPGDRVFVSSDHTESVASPGAINWGAASFNSVQIISVNRAGSVPPAAADAQSGAAFTASSGNVTLDPVCSHYYEGITFTATSGSIFIYSSGAKNCGFKNCGFVLSNSGSNTPAISPAAANPGRVTWDNCTVQFANVGQSIKNSGAATADFQWLNTPSAIQGATIPTNLFTLSTSGSFSATCRGVDLSAETGTLVQAASATAMKFLLDSCKVASGVTRYGGTPADGADEVELVNCYDGTNIINERHTPAGDLTTERSTTLSGGAQDDVGNYSLKMVSSSRAGLVYPLESFWLDCENTLTGSARTATVEIISSTTLNNTDVSFLLEHQGTSGSSLASFVSSVTSLTASSSLPASARTWNNQPSTPVKQYLQVSFTPQTAGRVRGLVRLHKASTTIWVNPQIAIA